MPHSNKDTKGKYKDVNEINKPSGMFAKLEFPYHDKTLDLIKQVRK
jgi:hypothetical protein